MKFVDGYGNPIVIESGGSGDSSELSTAFDVKKVNVGGGNIVDFYGDGMYYPNPFVESTDIINVYFYDEDKNTIPVYDSDGNLASHSTVGCFSFAKRISLQIEGLTMTTRLYVNYDRYLNGMASNTDVYTLAKEPTYVKFGGKVTYNIASDTEIADGIYMAHYHDDVCIGLYEQVNAYVQAKMRADIIGSEEVGRMIKSAAVKELNKNRDAYRLATFNIYGAGHAQRNWDCVKSMLQNFGIDLCACQEVKSPNGNLDTTNTKIFADEMKSWQFPYCSTNGDLYPTNERMLLSAFPVVSSYEWEYAKASSDRRCCAKYEVQLPLYKDRVGSDQIKMSIYNTQLEVYPTASGNATNRIAEAQEILDMIAVDENPFIAVLMDSNDFSPDKEIWKMFTDAGFTYAIPIKTQTVTAQDNCIDQIFVSKNMEILNYDVINGGAYTFFWSDKMNPVSDHDLCFADVRLKYDDFFCIKQTLTNVTSDCAKVIVDNDAALTINLTADSGYALGTVKVRMGHMDVTADVYADGVITIPAVTGDVYIIASGTAETTE